MSNRTIEILSPQPRYGLPVRALTPRLTTLAGKRIGFLDNGKHNADRLFRLLGERLLAECGVGAVTYHSKGIASMPAPPALLAELAYACDAVVTGSGD